MESQRTQTSSRSLADSFSEFGADCIRPSVTYGLCMPSALHVIAERTSDEFSIEAGRWGCRLAFLWSVSTAQVNRMPLPFAYLQWLVNRGGCDQRILK